MDSTVAALIGAIIGGLLSVLASWLAQRVQSRSNWLVQEIKQRQQLYSQFVEAASCCFADALQEHEPETAKLAALYGEIGRMRLISTEKVVREADTIAHKILEDVKNPSEYTPYTRAAAAEASVVCDPKGGKKYIAKFKADKQKSVSDKVTKLLAEK